MNLCKEIEEKRRDRKSSIRTSSGKTISFDNFALLEKDLKALESLGVRFKNVYKSNKQLIEECSEILKKQIVMSDPFPTVVSSTDFIETHVDWNQENQDTFLSSVIEFINSMTENDQSTSKSSNGISPDIWDL